MTWFLDHVGDVLDLAVQHAYLAGIPLVVQDEGGNSESLVRQRIAPQARGERPVAT